MGARINVKDLPASMQARYRQKRTRAVKVPVPLRGEACMMIWVTLPWPPTCNNLYIQVGNRRVMSREGKQYVKDVAKACDQQGIAHVIGRITVEMWAHPPDHRRRDLNNLWKVLLDSLVKAGVFGDDEQIDHETVHRESVEKDGCLNICLCGDYPV